MRPFKVTRASRPALSGFRDQSTDWTGLFLDELKIKGCRTSSLRRNFPKGQQSPNSKRWVFITGRSPTPTKFMRVRQLAGAGHYSTGGSGRNTGGRRRDPSFVYGAGWEGGGEDVAVAVWWDFENCHVPVGIEVYKVGVNIVSGLRYSGFKGPVSISAYGDTLQLSRSTQEALASTGIRLQHIPSGGKDSSDRALLVDLILWTLEHPPPAHLFLISGDRDFSNALHRLRMRNYNILLACPAGTTVSPSLLGAATHVWQWNSLVRGEGLLLATSPDSRPPDGSPGGGSYPRYGGPRPYSPGSRCQDGSGHSLEGGGVPIRPPTSPAVQLKTVEGQSSSIARKPDVTPLSQLQSSQKQAATDSASPSSSPQVAKDSTCPSTSSKVAKDYGSSSKSPQVATDSASPSACPQVVKDSPPLSTSPEDDGVHERPECTKPILRPVPKKVLNQFKGLLTAHPNGMMLADLQNYMRDGKVEFEKDFYGHKKVVPFLASIPHVVQMERVLMKDNRSWSYSLTLSQKIPRKWTEGAPTIENVEDNTSSGWQDFQQSPPGPQASSQVKEQASDMTSSTGQGKAELPSVSSSSEEGDTKKGHVISLPHERRITQTVQEEASRDLKQNTHAVEFREELMEEISQAEISSSGGANTSVPVLDTDSKVSGIAQGVIPLPSFLRLVVDAIKKWQPTRSSAEGPNSSQHVDGKEEKVMVQVPNPETTSTPKEVAEYVDQLKDQGFFAKLETGKEVCDIDPRYAEEVIEAVSREEIEAGAKGDVSSVLLEQKQRQSEASYKGAGGVVNDGINVRRAEELEGGSSQPRLVQNTSGIVEPEMQKDRRPAWKRWLYGATAEEVSSRLRASPEPSQDTNRDASTPSVVYGEVKVGTNRLSELPSRSEELRSSPTTSESPNTSRMGREDESLLWGHSFVIRLQPKNAGIRMMKVLQDLKEYLNSAEGSSLLSDASTKMEAVNMIRTKGPLQFRSLDSSQISDSVELLADGKHDFNWQYHDGRVRDGSVADVHPNELLKAEDPGANGLHNFTVETAPKVHPGNMAESGSQPIGKEIECETGNAEGHGPNAQTKLLNQEVRKGQQSLSDTNQVIGKEVCQGELDSSNMAGPTSLLQVETKVSGELVPSSGLDWRISSTVRSGGISLSDQPSPAACTKLSTSTGEAQSAHPTLEEFKEWFLKLMDNSFRRSVRVQKAGFDLSLVKPDFEKEFGVRLDPKAYGFFRVQDLIASMSSVRVSRPRVDQCVIHLLKFDADVTEEGNQSPEEHLEEVNGSLNNESQFWPKMYHDCKKLVRELMVANPEGITGVRLKPLFVSKYNYPLDHKRVGYQRLSDLLRLMPDVVSVNGNFLVPSEELLRSLKKEAIARKRSCKDLTADGSESLQEDELSPETLSQKGRENWSQIDSEANGTSSGQEAKGDISDADDDDEMSLDHLSHGVSPPKKLYTTRESQGIAPSLSDSENDSDEMSDVDISQYETVSPALLEPLKQKYSSRSKPSRVPEQMEDDGMMASSGPSMHYESSQEMDDPRMEDDQVEKWLSENGPEEPQVDVDSINSESKETRRVDFDGHLHEDWSTLLMKEDEIEESQKQAIKEQFDSYSDGSVVSQHEIDFQLDRSTGEEQESEILGSSEDPEIFLGKASTLDLGTTPCVEYSSGTTGDDRQEKYNSKSLELMRILQRKAEPTRLLKNPYFQESPASATGVDPSDDSVSTASGEPSKKAPVSNSLSSGGDVYSCTPSSENPDLADGFHDVKTHNIEKDIAEAEETSSTGNAENVSSEEICEAATSKEGSERKRQYSVEQAAGKSIWQRLFK